MENIASLVDLIIPAAAVLTGISMLVSLAMLVCGIAQVAKGTMKPQDLFLLLKAPSVYLMRQTRPSKKHGMSTRGPVDAYL